jgi:hypothetical protein
VLFRFLYANELPAHEDCGEELGLGEMVQAAKRFKAGELHEHCHKLFVQGLTVGNAISRLVLVHDQWMEQLQEAVKEYLKTELARISEEGHGVVGYFQGAS